MGVAFVEKEVLEDVIGFRQRRVDVAKLECLQAVDVAALAVRMDARLRLGEGFFRTADGVENLVLNFDQIESLGCRLLILGDDGGDRIADVAYMLRGERILVLSDRQDAEGDRKVLAGQHQVDTGTLLRFLDVYFSYQGVGMGRSQQLHVQHAGQEDVVSEARLAGDLGAAVDAAARLTDDVHARASARLPRSPRKSADNRCSGKGCRRLPLLSFLWWASFPCRGAPWPS